MEQDLCVYLCACMRAHLRAAYRSGRPSSCLQNSRLTPVSLTMGNRWHHNGRSQFLIPLPILIEHLCNRQNIYPTHSITTAKL